MKTIETTVYKFTELSEDAKQKAIDNVRSNEYYLDYDWYEFTYEYWMDKNTGFDIDKIYFSGFYSQGDGAMFEGTINDNVLDLIEPNYRHPVYKKDWERVLKLIKHGHINIYGGYQHSGHYYHEKCYTGGADYEIVGNHVSNLENITDILDDIISEIDELYEDTCREIYFSLEKEYDYLMSDEAIEEHLICNDYDFTEDGEQY